MEQVMKMNQKQPGGGRAVLVSPILMLYYLFSGTCMAMSWLMALGIAISVIAEVLAGGTMMVMAFLLNRQAGFMVGLFLFGLAMWLIVAPTIMLTREVFTGMKWISKYYVDKSRTVQNRLLGKGVFKEAKKYE